MWTWGLPPHWNMFEGFFFYCVIHSFAIRFYHHRLRGPLEGEGQRRLRVGGWFWGTLLSLFMLFRPVVDLFKTNDNVWIWGPRMMEWYDSHPFPFFWVIAIAFLWMLKEVIFANSFEFGTPLDPKDRDVKENYYDPRDGRDAFMIYAPVGELDMRAAIVANTIFYLVLFLNPSLPFFDLYICFW